MVTDIFARAERRIGGRWEFMHGIQPFDGWSSYRLFGFIADVRNYSAIEPISQPRGLPPGVELATGDDDYAAELDEEYLGEHDYSWLLLSELLTVDYDQIVEDRRFSGVVNGFQSGADTAQSGKGVKMTLCEFLGPDFFQELDRLKEAGVERIVFGFDS